MEGSTYFDKQIILAVVQHVYQMLVSQTDKTNILSVFSKTAIFIRNKLRKVINVRRFDVHLMADLKLDALF